MAAANTIFGPGYSVEIPPGYTIAQSNPMAGFYRLLPPGVSPFNIEAMIQIRSVQAFELQPLLQTLYSLENPMVAMQQCRSLELAGFLGMQPCRQVQMAQGPAHIREFDAMNYFGIPLRLMEVVMTSPQAAVEVLIAIALNNWTQFTAPCMEFFGRIILAGAPQSPQQLVAVVDEDRKDQVEYRLVGPNQQSIPLTALPTSVGGITIINVDASIRTGNINGTGIAIGEHSIAKVNWDSASNNASVHP
ncbi:MAG: hypothetical protein ABR860_14695 [Terracidiphilus sp.]|jgi:hypothetical protein